MANILILYAVDFYPLRSATRSLLESYKKYSGQRCFYLNAAYYRLSVSLKKVPFDLIIFDYSFFDRRWDRKAFISCSENVRVLEQSPALKIALVQDEFMNMDLVVDFIRRFSISHVFSLASPSEREKIYASPDLDRVRFHRVLPGYLDESLIPKIEKMAKQIPVRTIDIGYRTAKAWPSAGRFNQIKSNLTELIAKKAAAKGVAVDCKTGQENFFLGQEWYRFLLNCKYTVSVEGGASILDWDGSLMEQTKQYLEKHPKAGFDEVERACFAGREGELNYRSISPKHLEACVTRTCQILVEGDYNGILKPGEHYLELKKDFSNFDKILDTITDDNFRTQIVDRAYRDIVRSGDYNYRSFVEFILRQILPESHEKNGDKGKYFFVYVLTCFLDKLCFFWLGAYYVALRFFKKMLPTSVWVILKNAKSRIQRT